MWSAATWPTSSQRYWIGSRTRSIAGASKALPVALTRAARQDIREILLKSEQAFGGAARRRYRVLIEQALVDLSESPTPPGAWRLPELGTAYRAYPIRHPRPGLHGATVRRPRHEIVYRVETERLLVIRLLHDRQLIVRNVDPDADGTA